MTTTISITQTSVNAVPFGLPASQGTDPIIDDLFSHILSILEPKELGRAERVCKFWRTVIIETDQWKKQCQRTLNITSDIDPHKYIPKRYNNDTKDPCYKKTLQLILSRVFNSASYRYYLGVDTTQELPIPEGISLKRWKEEDPFDYKMIGQTCFWVYHPEYFYKLVPKDSPLDLDKPDHPNDEVASRLIIRKESDERSIAPVVNFQGIEYRELKIPNTIYNSDLLFQSVKNGNPSSISLDDLEEAEDEIKRCVYIRMPSGWTCMKEDVVGRGLNMNAQQALPLRRRAADGYNLIEERGFKISSLFHRVNFNFLRHASSGIVDEYPDGESLESDFDIHARTSTSSELFGEHFVCGFGSISDGLLITVRQDNRQIPGLGMAVELEALGDEES